MHERLEESPLLKILHSMAGTGRRDRVIGGRRPRSVARRASLLQFRVYCFVNCSRRSPRLGRFSFADLTNRPLGFVTFPRLRHDDECRRRRNDI
ncbi:hypothetical protein EVAR_31288_1 [Eumeta japonica]|uniref:Uncharacterized protein n=1 Tax=Eumeta variegata TaxID=151549 RepID=A0A4C1VR55_EUMVA|nr:hypothetical protein EVAR_31288_1 [Eumeta japonica]